MPRKRPGARPCKTCALHQTVRKDGICQSCDRRTRPRQTVTCGGGCGKETRRIEQGICKTCEADRIGGDFSDPDPSDGLSDEDGDWRFDPFRRVQVWVEKPPTPELEPQWPQLWDDTESAAELRMQALIADDTEEAA